MSIVCAVCAVLYLKKRSMELVSIHSDESHVWEQEAWLRPMDASSMNAARKPCR
jgi:hypothetical protein